MLIDPQINAPHFYPRLVAKGFRRSGDQVYRPYCQHCQACQSLRISPQAFIPSRSQKRLYNKNKAFRIELSDRAKAQYFDLYQNYINIIHPDGPMFPACKAQYNEFIKSSWNQCLFLEIYDQEKLISVSITDIITDENNMAWSAFYCFYDPDYRAYSLGTFAVLSQLTLAKELKVDWLYLGYYIKKCRKMNYKTQFNSHQLFIDEQWLTFNSSG